MTKSADAPVGADPETRRPIFGKVRIFVTPPRGISQIRWYLDPPADALEEPSVAGQPNDIDTRVPFDFAFPARGQGNGAAFFDTTQVPDGPHTIVAAIDRAGGADVLVANVIVHNGARTLLFDKSEVKFQLPANRRTSQELTLRTSDDASAAYTLSENAPWLRIEALSPIEDDARTGVAPVTQILTVDTSGLEPGGYNTTLSATSSAGYETDSIAVTMEVTAESTCSPVPCSEILVDLPYELDFSADHGKVLDGNNIGTGFTYIDQPTQGTGYIPQNLTVNTAAPGTLQLETTAGIQYTDANAQDNALGVGIDAPSQISVLTATLLDPPSGTGKYEQAGLWFGNDEDNYIKLVVISTPKGVQIQHLMEVDGAPAGSQNTNSLNLSGATLELSLRVDPGSRTIAAFYSINGGTQTSLGIFDAPSEFFSFDAAGIDPTIGTRSFGGIFATHRNGAPVVYTFDDFSVVNGGVPPPPSGDIEFDRVSFSVPNPTSMVWGPDNRLYVSELFGRIHAITLNGSKQVVADEVITTLGTRLTLGITVDPLSTPGNVILWVSHSSPSTSNGEANSSTVTRLSGSGFTTRADVITGLPRAIANHAINSIHFGPDGRLYMAVGGNTGAGAPNTANTEFGTRAEQPLSAALLVADVHASGFDGTCATPVWQDGQGGSYDNVCDAQVYASGLRNMYDFVWHSNGHLYGPDNGLGVTGTFPPQPTPACEGYGNPSSWTSGGHNPGEQPDILLRIQQGRYYGHPNPYRNECVFKNGSHQGVASPSNYVAPIYSLGRNLSANGTIEYTSDVFGQALQGELLIANYSRGDDITRVKLANDGLTVVEAKQLEGGFSNPLPLVQGPDGTIYVGELGAGRVTALIPDPSAPPPTTTPGTWTTKQSMPAAVLDAGGAALNGKLYMVGGKTSSQHLSTMHIYDPASNGWTTGPDLPGPAVENPAVVSLNSKLYAFGGSTAPFSGAVPNAAVFDPATAAWTPLAAMPTARGGATAQALDGKIYVIGGMDSNGASLANVAVYDPATNSWGTAPSLGTRRDNPGSAVLNGKIYVFGGRIRNSNGSTENETLNTVEMYDPATDSWTARASMPTGRRALVTGTLNGRAQVMGGERTSSGGTFDQNEEYDPATDSWRTLAAMPTGRHGAVAGTINGAVYVAGGGPNGGSSFTTVNEAFALDDGAPGGDTTPPETTIDSGPSGTVNSSSASFTFSSNEAGSTFECRLDGAAFSACTTPKAYTGLADGDHTFEVRAIDQADNVDETPASRSWTVDTASGGNGISLPGRIEAEDYESGGEGVGYHDTTGGNSGGAYRSDDVDIQATSDASGAYNVGWIAAGEWLAYDVNVENSGDYTFRLRVSSPNSGRSMHVEIDGANATGSIGIPNTAGWQNWTDVVAGPVALAAGSHQLRLVFDSNGFNINYAEVEPATGGGGISLPGRIEAEDYESGGEGVGYHDTTSGNSGGAYRSDDVDIQATSDASGAYNVGWIAAGEWLAYDVNVENSGDYIFRLRVSSPNNGRSMHVEIDGANATGSIGIPNTAGWQNWTDVVAGPVALAAGSHQLRLVFDANSFNINYAEVEPATAGAAAQGVADVSQIGSADPIDTAPTQATETTIQLYLPITQR